MRLVTWNAARGKFATKARLLDHLDPDVCVIQEIGAPGQNAKQVLWFGDNPNIGLAVVAKTPYTLTPLPAVTSGPKYVIPVRVNGPVSFVLFAVWTVGQQDFKYVRAVTESIDLYRDTFARETVVVMGDFNSNAIWDREHPTALNHSAMVAKLEGHGLGSAYHFAHEEDHGAEKQHTFYLQKNHLKKFHIDYCFLPKSWLPRIRHVDVGAYAAWYKVSDHCPLLVEVDSEALKQLPEDSVSS